MSTWKDFTTIFNLNKPEMLQTGDTGEDVGRIWNAVLDAAKNIGVEERVIFCIIMQESTGNVGVGTTTDNDTKATGGLMQCEESPAFPGKHGLSQVSVPMFDSFASSPVDQPPLQEQISSMVNAGTKHYKANLEQVGNADTAECIYKALRLYNSGSMNENNLSDAKGATASYVSDIANRLQGRVN